MNVVAVDQLRSASVRFVSRADGSLESIEIDSPTGRSAIADVHWALYSLNVEIIHTVARVKGERLLESIFVAERDGKNVSKERQLVIQRELIPLICEQSGQFEVQRPVEAESGHFPVRRVEPPIEDSDVREIA